MSKITVQCDCMSGDECPQGKTGLRRCSILRYEDGLDATSRERKEMLDSIRNHKPVLEVNQPDERMKNLVDGAHIRCDVLTARVSQLESHTGRHAMAESIDGIEEHLLSIRDALMADINAHTSRLNDISKQFAANEDTMKTQDRAIGILSDRLDHHNISLPQEASIKRVYKGGWINVYWDDQSQRTTIGAYCLTKAEADRADCNGRRIACIQIPDITVGEGL